MKMDIKLWSKSPDGIAMIDSQKVFCIGTQLWQGFKGCAIRSHEDQLTTAELQEIARERDVDDTMQAVWFRRKNRLESRFMRKSREYDDRGAVLRRERNEIRNAIRADKADKIPTSPADLRAIKRIDARMERMNLLQEEEEARLAELHERAGPHPDLSLLTDEREKTIEQQERLDAGEAEQPKVSETACPWPGCGKETPPGKNPKSWLKAHEMGAHIGPQRRAENKAARELEEAKRVSA